MNKHLFFRILSFMQRKAFFIVGLMIIACINMLFQVQISFMFKDMFNFIQQSNFNDMFGIVGKKMLVIVILFSILPFFLYLTQSIAVETTGAIRKRVFHKLTKLPISFYKKHHSGDITSRMTNDIIEMEKAYKEYFINFVTNIITGIGTTIFMFVIEWRLAIVAIMGGFITVIINIYFSKRLRIISDEVQERLARLNERLSNIIAGMKVIRVFNLTEIMLTKFQHSNHNVYSASNKRVNNQAIIDSLNSLVSIISFVGITTYGAYLAINGEILIGVIIAVVQLQNGVSMLVNSLGTFISQNQSALAAASRVFMILDEEDEPIQYDQPEKDVAVDSMIQFDRVSFGYEASDIIQELSFQIPKDKVYALVGASGSGKSTIFKLLLQFYKPTEGTIKIKNQETIQDIRDFIAYVPQDAYLFSGTVAENIAYGKLDATMDEIIQAAKLACAHDFISSFDNGYETQVLENGSKLSGGQRQRIAIARAFLKDAPILLLDEATSSLDSESEELIQTALNQLMKGRTTMIIAHRLSTVKNADQILVLNDGKIVESGTHDELLSINQVYANLYNKQFMNQMG